MHKNVATPTKYTPSHCNRSTSGRSPHVPTKLRPSVQVGMARPVCTAMVGGTRGGGGGGGGGGGETNLYQDTTPPRTTPSVLVATPTLPLAMLRIFGITPMCCVSTSAPPRYHGSAVTTETAEGRGKTHKGGGARGREA